jgi:hypothetical protein
MAGKPRPSKYERHRGMIMRMVEAGRSPADIGERLGVNEKAAAEIIRRLGIAVKKAQKDRVEIIVTPGAITVTRDDGQSVTVLPVRYAEGYQRDLTARPRRNK